VLAPEAAGATNRGIPVRIQDDVSGLDAPIVEMSWRLEQRGDELVSEWLVPDNESGWHRNSARPGEGSNIVISGHNSSSGGQVFGHLDDLAPGSRLTIWTDTGDAFDYQVTDKQIVRVFGATQETLAYLQQVIQPTDTERLTLITCWPSWTNTHRLIVIAEPL
jgi:sortase A